MVSFLRKLVAKKNIKKAQKKWKSMTPRARALAQPQGRARAKPGTKGKGGYYRIIVRPKTEFISFRYHDVGRKGHTLRLAGRKKNGSWATQSWLISKKDAVIENGKIIAKDLKIKKILNTLSSIPKRVKGNVFRAKPRRNVPEKAKPTPAMRKAQKTNIKKAQKARRKKTKK